MRRRRVVNGETLRFVAVLCICLSYIGLNLLLGKSLIEATVRNPLMWMALIVLIPSLVNLVKKQINEPRQRGHHEDR